MMKKPSCESGRAFVFVYPSQCRSSLFNNVTEVSLKQQTPLEAQKLFILGLLEAWWVGVRGKAPFVPRNKT